MMEFIVVSIDTELIVTAIAKSRTNNGTFVFLWLAVQ